MNRSDLIDELAARFVNLTKNDTEFAVNTLIDAMQDALVAGHHIEMWLWEFLGHAPRCPHWSQPAQW